jgi:hypothetical protein
MSLNQQKKRTMAKKLTQAKRMQAYMDASMYQVMELLEWNLMKYCMFKYECGLAYLNAYLQGDPVSIDLLQRSAAYWGWWKLHWYIREKEYLQLCKMHGDKGIHARRSMFMIVHNPNDLAHAVSPNGKVLEDSYSKDLVPSLR